MRDADFDEAFADTFVAEPFVKRDCEFARVRDDFGVAGPAAEVFAECDEAGADALALQIGTNRDLTHLHALASEGFEHEACHDLVSKKGGEVVTILFSCQLIRRKNQSERFA
jgi:hypothetical protein